MNGSGGGNGQSAGDVVATSRDANGWSPRPGSGGPHAAGVGQEAPPVPRAGFATGDEGGRGAGEAGYVHTTGTSSQATGWTGTSRQGEAIHKSNKRDRDVQVTVNSLKLCGREKQAKALADCGKHCKVWATPDLDCKVRPQHCDSMFCPHCAKRRGRLLVKKLMKLVGKKDRSYWVLTLTVPNVENLSKFDILDIQKLWSRLWRSWVFQEVEGPDRKPWRIYGGVRSIECVYNEEKKSWHPHIHVLFEAPKKLPWWWLILLKAAWKGPDGEQWYLHLDRAYSVTKRGTKMYSRLNDKALREVCKYVTKSAEFAGNHLLVDEFLRAFKGVRRIQCFGSFHNPETKSVCREPGEDEVGGDRWEPSFHDQGYECMPFTVPLRDTVLLANGDRQLSFAWRERVRMYFESKGPPSVPWLRDEGVRVGSGVEFAGAMPEKSERQASLFGVAA